MTSRYALTAALLALTGCVTTGTTSPSAYDSSRSRAYNLAQAAGISDARDTERRHLSENEIYKIASNTDLFMWDRGANWSAGQALGASLLFSALEPTSNFAKDSLFGWMPEDMAEDAEQARRRMSEVATSAIKQSLDNLGYTYETTLESYDQKAVFGDSAFLFSQITIVDPAAGCPAPDSVDHYSKTCYASSQVVTPEKQLAPDFVGSGQSFAFGTIGVRQSEIRLKTPEGVSLDTLGIMGQISRNLPNWAFLFIAENSKSKTPPLVLDGDKVRYFVEPARGDGHA